MTDTENPVQIFGSATAIAELLSGISRPSLSFSVSATPPEVSQSDDAPAMVPPQIGEVWRGQGGIYAGLSRGVDGARDAHLILASESPAGDMNWDAAVSWAQTVSADAHTDFRLPTRSESALLFANLRDQFDARWYWTGEQYSRTGAWTQYFGDGFQYGGAKSYEGRARAVRRFIA